MVLLSAGGVKDITKVIKKILVCHTKEHARVEGLRDRVRVSFGNNC